MKLVLTVCTCTYVSGQHGLNIVRDGSQKGITLRGVL